MRSTLVTALFVSCALPAFAAPVLSIQPSNTTVIAGQTFSVAISVADAVDLYGFQPDLEYDPTPLSATSNMEGALPTAADPGGQDGAVELSDEIAAPEPYAVLLVGTGLLVVVLWHVFVRHRASRRDSARHV